MGMFNALFGNSTSDAAQKARQDALNAFNAIQTPELKALQVQLQNQVVAGKLTPDEAESQLLSSNAFNDIATDPTLVGAQKQAIQQLQQIGTQGGLTAVDKAQLNDINNAQNQQNQSQNAATMQQMQQRGMGNSNLNAVNQLVNEQGSADRAANSGLNVAAQAQARALQALQGAGSQAGALQQQEYGQAANKAQAQNAIDLFNKQTLNATNLYNVDAANKAQAANLQNAQNVSNTNTGTANTQALTNAQAVQQQYQDALSKASGIAGINTAAANADQAQKNMETGANMGLLTGALQAGGTALAGPIGGAFASGAGSAAGSATTPHPSQYAPTNEGDIGFAEGGEVTSDHPSHPSHMAMGGTVHCYAYGGDIHHHPDCYMAQGGDTPSPIDPSATQSFMQGMMDKPKPSLPIEWSPETSKWELRDKTGNHIGSFAAYSDAADFADKVASKATPQKMAKGGKIGPIKKGALHAQMGIPQSKPIPAGRLEAATNSDNELLRKRAQFAENAKHWNHAEGGEVKDFRTGGPVPGIPQVPHNSFKNDTVRAKLSPGEVVVPLDAQKSDDDFEHFMNQFKPSKKTPKIAPDAPLDKLALSNLHKRMGK